jgi:predicted AAA+ superfamily ATPase
MEEIEKVYNQALEKHGEDIKDFYIYISRDIDYKKKTYKGLRVNKINVMALNTVYVSNGKVIFADQELLQLIKY